MLHGVTRSDRQPETWQCDLQILADMPDDVHPK